MIRVVYRWRVPEEHQRDFIELWTGGTPRIRDTVPGARGSMLMRERDDKTEFLAVARWESYEDWRAFWDAGEAGRKAATQTWELAGPVGVEVYEEVADYTK